jgi:hypothetical protein
MKTSLIYFVLFDKTVVGFFILSIAAGPHQTWSLPSGETIEKPHSIAFFIDCFIAASNLITPPHICYGPDLVAAVQLAFQSFTSQYQL